MSATGFQVGTVGIVGGGLMGTGIAEVTALAGLPTVLVKATPGNPRGGLDRIEKSLAKQVEKKKLAPEAAAAALGRITATCERDALDGADLVIESVIEDLDTKRQLFFELDRRLGAGAVLASNTSTLRVGDLAEGLGRAHRTIGLHFFSPVPAMALVELAYLPETDPQVVAGAHQFIKAIGKTGVPVIDSSGFIVNRLLVPYLVGSIAAYGQGLAGADEIDTAMKLGCAHPMGPLALSDLIGLDVVYAMAKLLYKDFGDARYRPPALLRRLVQDGALGKKTKLGFYDYATNPPRPNPIVEDLVRVGDLVDEITGEHVLPR